MQSLRIQCNNPYNTLIPPKNMDLKVLFGWLIWLLFTLLIALTSTLIELNGIMSGIFVAWLMIPVTYYSSTYFFGKRKIDRWKQLKKISFMELNNVLNGVFSEMANIADFDSSATAEGGTSNEELSKMIKKKMINQLHLKAKNKSAKIDDPTKEILLAGKYGKIFERRSSQLEKYLDRYKDYLEPEDIANVLKISQGLYRLDMEISIRNKYKKNNWNLFKSDSSIEETLRLFINEIIRGLDYFNRKGIFVYS